MQVKQQLRLNEVEPGQVLATDVCDLHGNCLISAGQTLSKEICTSLQRRHIEIVTVWQEQSYSKTEIIAQQVAIKAQLAHRFRQMLDNPEMRHLHGLLLNWRLQPFTQDEPDDEGSA